MLNRIGLCISCLSIVSSAFGQLALPNPAWLPPNASEGAVQSNSTSTGNPQWRNILGDLLYFYECQRSGTLPDTNRVSWRNDSALQDGNDWGIDLTGGYYDAGDYVKFTYPLTFTLTSICWGALDAGKGYDMANQTAYLDSMLRWGLDWLIKAHPLGSTLFMQVGNADVDNAYWGGDQGIPEPRLAFQINDTSPGTDAAAQASAAFSSCSALYSGSSFSYSNANISFSPGHASLQNGTYASTLLNHASQLYSFATNASGGQMVYQTSVPTSADAYGSSSYTDELVLAQLFLGLASNSSEDVETAQSMYGQFKLGGGDSVFNWDSKTPGLAVLGVQLAESGRGGNRQEWAEEAEQYFDRILNGSSPGFLTKGGLLWYEGDSDDASLNPALNAAMLMARYAPLASSAEKTRSYLDFAQGQLEYALGNNPMKAPYVVGVNPNSPQNPHSAMASGGSDISHIDTSPKQEAYVLYGGVVGGPDVHDKYYDIRSDWPQTEVALDYVAPMLTLAALHVMNDTSDPFYTSLKAGAFDKKRPHGKPCDAVFSCAVHFPVAAKVVIGVVLSIVGLAMVGLAAAWVLTGFRNSAGKGDIPM